jgi:hypothetical protein
MQCVIQWIDETGMPTPDNNQAVAIVTRMSWTEKREDGDCVYTLHSYPICQEHLKRLPIKHWSIIPLFGISFV